MVSVLIGNVIPDDGGGRGLNDQFQSLQFVTKSRLRGHCRQAPTTLTLLFCSVDYVSTQSVVSSRLLLSKRVPHPASKTSN